MSLVKQTDVKNHLSPRYRSKIHLCDSVSQRDATSVSGAEADAFQADPSTFAGDLLAEHSLPSTVQVPGAPLTGSFSEQAPEATISVQP